MDLMGKRMEVADQIGAYKKDNNISILQPARWNEILEHAVQQGKEKGLSKKFIETVLRAIHEESISHQTKVMNEKQQLIEE